MSGISDDLEVRIEALHAACRFQQGGRNQKYYNWKLVRQMEHYLRTGEDPLAKKTRENGGVVPEKFYEEED